MKHLLPIIPLFFLYQSVTAQEKIPGFDSESSVKQKKMESELVKQINISNLDLWMKKLTAHPHHVGSDYNHEISMFIADQFRSWGYQVSIDTYYVLFPTPKIRALEMTAPTKYRAILAEPKLTADATSGQVSEQAFPVGSLAESLKVRPV